MKLLQELVGIKQLHNLEISDLIEYYIKATGYQLIGEGASGTVFKHPTKNEIIKFWLVDSAYDTFMSYALRHQDNKNIVKVLQRPKHLTMFHSRPTKVQRIEYDEPLVNGKLQTKVIEFPDKLTYTRLELLKPIGNDTKVFGIIFSLLLQFIQATYAADSHAVETFDPKKIESIIDLIYDEEFGTEKPANTDMDGIIDFFTTVMTMYKEVGTKFNYDLHEGNVMLRGNVPVIIDPFADIPSMDTTSDFNFYSQRANIVDAIEASKGPRRTKS